jgi:hypothetical protein
MAATCGCTARCNLLLFSQSLRVHQHACVLCDDVATERVRVVLSSAQIEQYSCIGKAALSPLRRPALCGHVEAVRSPANRAVLHGRGRRPGFEHLFCCVFARAPQDAFHLHRHHRHRHQQAARPAEASFEEGMWDAISSQANKKTHTRARARIMDHLTPSCKKHTHVRMYVCCVLVCVYACMYVMYFMRLFVFPVVVGMTFRTFSRRYPPHATPCRRPPSCR